MYKSISPRIKSLGVDDLAIGLFENQYPVPDGITYNSYLVESDAPIVMDTVDSRFADEWLSNLDEALEGRTPDALVCLHLEPDHSGTLTRALEAYPSMKLVVSARAAQMLPQFADAAVFEGRVTAVKEGDTFGPLRFIMAPMVHWPEVMTAWFEEEKTLFGADGFGTFGTPGRPQDDWAPEAARYYFNIVGKYGVQVQGLLKKCAALPIERICSLHGPVLEGDMLGRAVSLYDTWSSYRADCGGVFIAVASIYGHTLAAAEKLRDMLEGRGIDVCLIDLCHTDVSYAVAEAFRRPTVVFGASSYDASVFPPMAQLLHHLQIKGWRGRRVALIENYSWGATAARTMRSMLEPMKEITPVEPTVSVKTRLDAASTEALERLSGALAV